MKQIITISKKSCLTINNGKRELSTIIQHSSSWHYAELKPNSKETTTFYQEFLERAKYQTIKSKTKKEKKLGDTYSYFYTNWIPIKFSVANFISYEVNTTYCEQNNYTLQMLIKKLPADEMIEYLKDNKLVICPMLK